MKKTLVAAALLGTFAASAFAAPSVTMYGLIDTGIDGKSGFGVGRVDHL